MHASATSFTAIEQTRSGLNFHTVMSEKEIKSSSFNAVAVREGADNQHVESERESSGGALHRYINASSAINFSFLLQCSWEAAATVFPVSLLNGGPASLIYGTIFAGFGTTLVALSLAEMSSMDPTVGAQYRWSAAFAPKWNRFFGLLQGWITVFAWICACTSNPAIISNTVVGLASFNHAEYEPKQWHSTVIMWGVTIVPFIGNFWLPRFITLLETAGCIFHVGFFFASVITLAVMGEKSSAGYVFGTLTHDASGWTNPTVAWGIGLLTVTYPLSGFDGVLHMSEEVKNARTRVPRSMMFSVVVNGIMQFLYLTTVLFTIGDVDQVTASTLPIAEVYYQATGSRAATNLFMFNLIYVFFVSFFNIFASVSRLVWAFSKDDGLPFSHVFAKVDSKLKMPVNALCFVATCVCLLALINVGSSTAFNASISLPAMGLYISYFFPIFFLFWRRLSCAHSTPIPWGPFKLGRAGPYINAAAMCYIVFTLIWMPFPGELPVDRLNMNYAGPIVGVILLLGTLD